jgi:putative intracellular protease/amidase
MAVAYAQAPPSRGTLVTKVDAPRVIHMALRRDARTIDFETAVEAARRDSLRWAAEKSGDARTTRAEVLAEAYSSPTRWALAHGYDAVLIPKGDGYEVAVLNRTALIVAREFEQAGENVTRRIHEAEESE